MPSKKAAPPAAPVPELDLQLVELQHYDAEELLDEDADFEDEVPADEGAYAKARSAEDLEEDETFDEEPDDEAATGELTSDDYSGERRVELPQPDRARSSPDLPKVKSSAFKRIIR